MQWFGSIRLVVFSGRGFLSATPSVIVKCTPEHHHVVHHSFAPVAKLIPQNPQPFHAGQCVLNFHPFAAQQSVERSTLPMQPTPLGFLPWRDHRRRTRLQSDKAAISQHGHPLRKAQPLVLDHSLVVPPARHRARTPSHLALGRADHVLDRVPLFASAVIATLPVGASGPGQPPFGAVNDKFAPGRLGLQQEAQFAGFAGGQVKGHQLPYQSGQAANPITDLSLGNAKEDRHDVLRRVGFVVNKDEEELVFSRGQHAFAPTAGLPLAGSSFGGLLGEATIINVREDGGSEGFISLGGRIPAPVQSFKN